MMKNRSKEEIEQNRRKRTRFFVALLLFINGYLFLSLLFGEMGTLKLIKMKREYSRLREEIQSLHLDNEALTRRIDGLKTDPGAIEALARDRLGLAREGELVYEFYDR